MSTATATATTVTNSTFTFPSSSPAASGSAAASSPIASDSAAASLPIASGSDAVSASIASGTAVSGSLLTPTATIASAGNASFTTFGASGGNQVTLVASTVAPSGSIPTSTSQGSSESNKTAVLAGAAAGGALVLLVVGCIFLFCIWKRRRRAPRQDLRLEAGSVNDSDASDTASTTTVTKTEVNPFLDEKSPQATARARRRMSKMMEAVGSGTVDDSASVFTAATLDPFMDHQSPEAAARADRIRAKLSEAGASATSSELFTIRNLKSASQSTLSSQSLVTAMGPSSDSRPSSNLYLRPPPSSSGHSLHSPLSPSTPRRNRLSSDQMKLIEELTRYQIPHSMISEVIDHMLYGTMEDSLGSGSAATGSSQGRGRSATGVDANPFADSPSSPSRSPSHGRQESVSESVPPAYDW